MTLSYTKKSTSERLENTLPEWVVTTSTVNLVAHTSLTTVGQNLVESYPNSYHGNDGENLIEFGGRSCYQSHHNPAGRTTDEYIKNIISQQHYSVLEHANVSFYIEGVSRSFTHELIRHRHLSYSQLSQRYVDSTDARFVLPPLYREDAELAAMWSGHIQTVRDELATQELRVKSKYPELAIKQIRESVRSIAPNCIETKILVTGNLRAWRDFLEKRWNSHADREIQEVAEGIVTILKANYSSTFKDITYC